MFFRLGIQNAWRNLARSILAVVSMALAAAFFTYVISLGRGYSNLAGQPLRRMFNGEIVVYADKITAEIPDENTIWQYQWGALDSFTDLSLLFPKMAATGYLTTGESGGQFSKKDLAALAAEEELDGIHALYRMPADTVTQVDPAKQATPVPQDLLVMLPNGSYTGPEVSYHSTLQARDLTQESAAYSMEPYLTSGRWLEKNDNASLVGVVSANQFTPEFTKAPAVGDVITVEVPAFSLRNGEWIADYTNSRRWQIEIVGTVSVVTRSVDYMDPIGGLITEKVYAYYPDIYLPLDTWQMIWQQAANGAAFQPAELLLQVDDLTFLEDIVYDLQQKYPQYSFVSMPNQLDRVLAALSLEPVIPRLAQDAVNAQVTLLNQTVLSADLRLPLTLLVLLNAGLLVAANILILVSERKKEIGILKAVGAKRLDIIIMILGEVILVTAIGSGMGFFFIRIQSLLNQMTNPSTFASVLLLFAQDFLIVMCATSCLAVVFGFIPARNYAKLSVMEVLRNE